MPTTPSKKSAETLSLRITVVDPPPDILWALQLRQDEIVNPSFTAERRISFEFTVEVIEDSSARGFRLRGPAVQGSAGKRFVYLRMGAYAGQAGITAGWRAKIGLETISRALINKVIGKPSGMLEVEFAGTSPKGGPACATVPLLGEGWRPV